MTVASLKPKTWVNDFLVDMKHEKRMNIGMHTCTHNRTAYNIHGRMWNFHRRSKIRNLYGRVCPLTLPKRGKSCHFKVHTRRSVLSSSEAQSRNVNTRWQLGITTVVHTRVRKLSSYHYRWTSVVRWGHAREKTLFSIPFCFLSLLLMYVQREESSNRWCNWAGRHPKYGDLLMFYDISSFFLPLIPMYWVLNFLHKDVPSQFTPILLDSNHAFPLVFFPLR